MSELLTVEDLSRRYGARWALDGLELRLRQGEALGLLGANGAGKSTCLRLLAGILAPTRGTVRILGLDLAHAPRRAKRHLGYLPERPPLHLDMRVGEYLEYCARLHRLPRASRREAVDWAIARSGLAEVAGRLLGQLSKGYRQRVGIAQAVVHRPELVILDEPTDGLDPVQAREMRTLIRTLAKDCGVILSSHRLPEVQAVCNRVLILREGRVLHQAVLDEAAAARRFRLRLERPPDGERLARLPGVRAVQTLAEGAFRLRLAPEAPVTGLAARVVESGWGLMELAPERPDLEQIFFDLVGGEDAA